MDDEDPTRDDSADNEEQLLEEVRNLRRNFAEYARASSEQRGERVRLLIALGILGLAGTFYAQGRISFPTLELFLGNPFIKDALKYSVYGTAIYVILKIFFTFIFERGYGKISNSISKIASILFVFPIFLTLSIILTIIVIRALNSIGIDILDFMGLIVLFVVGLAVILSLMTFFDPLDTEMLEKKIQIMEIVIANTSPHGLVFSKAEIAMKIDREMLYSKPDEKEELDEIIDGLLNDNEVPLTVERGTEIHITNREDAEDYLETLENRMEKKQRIKEIFPLYQ